MVKAVIRVEGRKNHRHIRGQRYGGSGGQRAYRSLIPGHGQGIEVLLQRTRDDKPQKSRLHLDLRAAALHR